MRGWVPVARLLTTGFVFLFWATQTLASPASAAVIGQRIEQLASEGRLQIQGRNIAAGEILQAFYAERQYQPAWGDPEKANQLVALIEASATHGLNPNDYFQSQIGRALMTPAGSRKAEQEADTDILMTDALLRYAFHRAFGKVNSKAIDNDINFKRQLFRNNPPEVSLKHAMASKSLDSFIESGLPQGLLYQSLRAVLVEYLAIASDGGWEPIPPGAVLHAGDRDARVPALRRRLAITADLPAHADMKSETYDEDVILAIKSFQLRHQLNIDSVAGANTLAALNVPVEKRIDQLRLSLERLRWVQGEVTDDLVAVNIAGFRVFLIQDGKITWNSRAMVGKTYRQTPVFRGDMAYMEFNPTWTIPPGILRNDILQKDPAYLANNNMSVIDHEGKTIDSSTVNWQSYSGSIPYMIRQEPGPQNALGTVKFIFPNQHFVFIHDTPHRELYVNRERAFSSGCIRIQDPLRLAELILKDPQKYGRSELEAIVDGASTQRILLKQKLPVLILYLTASIDEDANVRFYDDIYKRDQRILDALNGPVIFDAPDPG
jgi:murein L,D-transpeptidase YcbB/YkuD